MAGPYNPPKKGQAFQFAGSLQDMNNVGSFKSTPTLASGDFQVDKDGGGFVNLTNLPTNTPAASVRVSFSLTAAEMTADVVTIACIDQTSPKEWGDFVFVILTTA